MARDRELNFFDEEFTNAETNDLALSNACSTVIKPITGRTYNTRRNETKGINTV